MNDDKASSFSLLVQSPDLNFPFEFHCLMRPYTGAMNGAQGYLIFWTEELICVLSPYYHKEQAMDRRHAMVIS